MKHLKLYEDIDWSDEDFEEEEFDTELRVGDILKLVKPLCLVYNDGHGGISMDGKGNRIKVASALSMGDKVEVTGVKHNKTWGIIFFSKLLTRGWGYGGWYVLDSFKKIKDGIT